MGSRCETVAERYSQWGGGCSVTAKEKGYYVSNSGVIINEAVKHVKCDMLVETYDKIKELEITFIKSLCRKWHQECMRRKAGGDVTFVQHPEPDLLKKYDKTNSKVPKHS